jgi:hypothetical protein
MAGPRVATRKISAQGVVREQLDLLHDAVGELRFQHAKGAATPPRP